MSEMWRVKADIGGSRFRPKAGDEKSARHHFEQCRNFISTGGVGYASLSVRGPDMWHLIDHCQSPGYVRQVVTPPRAAWNCEGYDE